MRRRSWISRRLTCLLGAAALLVGAVGFERARASSPPCRYTVANGGTASGTVYDVVTGLTWQQFLSTSTYTWSAAQTYCATLNYAGGTGWRVPTIKELASIVDITTSAPAIDVNYFPNTPPTSYFWTSSPYQGDANNGSAWYVYFYAGATASSSVVTASYNVRCVR